MTPLFTTGFLRSGTTLLEKYLHNHPQMVVASQPLPFVFTHAKREFYASLGHEPPAYPLGHLQGEGGYRREDFLAFLMQHRFSSAALQPQLEAMRGYSGQLTPAVLDMPVPSGSFFEVYSAYASRYPALFGKPHARYSGSKEVFCEEFIPLFLAQDCPVVLILRDPRAVVASIHGGRGGEYANAGLSVLYILRCWRKSVAYALRYAEHPCFHAIHYEALAQSPAAVLQPLAQALGLSPFPDTVVAGTLLSQDGTAWRGNSSFSRPDSGAPRYLQVLDAGTIAFIDTLCAAEMHVLGMSHSPQETAAVLEHFREPFLSGRPALSEQDKQDELQRAAMLAHPMSSDEQAVSEAQFIFAPVRQMLYKQ